MRARPLLAWSLLSLAVCAAGGPMDEEPRAATVARGERLLAGASCTACHAAAPEFVERLAPRTGPDLSRIGARYEPRALRRFLLRPHATQPGTPMPDLLSGFAQDERERAADELVQYLASLGGPFDGRPTSIDIGTLERGRQLYHSVGCIACHAPQEGADELLDPLWRPSAPRGPARSDDQPPYVRPGTPAPGQVPLGELTARTNVPALAAFLADPLSIRADGFMPALGLASDEAHAIAAYLLRHQASAELDPARRTPGLRYEYFEAPRVTEFTDALGLEPMRRGVVPDLERLPEHRADHFALRFEGLLEVPARGTWRFTTDSDDGSRLWIGDRLVVRNDGIHPVVSAAGELTLEAGLHPIRITFFEHEGGQELRVSWEGPGVPRQPLPARALSHLALELAPPRARALRVDAALVEAGRARFAALACGACHRVEGEPTFEPSAPPFAALHAAGAAGCLAPEPRAGLPRYGFDGQQRASLGQTLAHLDLLAEPLGPRELVAQRLERLRCLQCHERDGLGGIHPERADYFIPLDEALDLGDQARYPPSLEQVGRKLRAERLEQVLAQGIKARPYLAARMPRFGERSLAGLAAAFAALDLRPGDDLEPEPDAQRIASGRKLVGTSGLGCVQCHAFAGFEALGTPAVDLADAFAHTRPGWFADLLRDPAGVGLLSRMPQLWTDGRSPVGDVHGGDVEEQIASIRAYLSLGRGAPLPEGLVLPEDAYELVVGDEPLLVGVFFAGASPRTMLVGTPEGLHYAFDQQNSRPVALWRGRFFDARGTWHGRAGTLERAPVPDAFTFEPGMALAVLPTPDAPWPTAIGRAAGFRRLGQRFDARRHPIWRYALGELVVEEHLHAELGPRGLTLKRAFEVECRAAEPPALYLRTFSAGDERRTPVPFERAPDAASAPRWIGRVETRIEW